MIAIYIDSRITGFRNEIKYSCDFIFKTLGYEIKHISHPRELNRNDIVIYYSKIKPNQQELYAFARDKIIFYIPFEKELYDIKNMNLDYIRSMKKEITLSRKIPVFSTKDISIPVNFYNTKFFFFGSYSFDMIGNIFFHLSDTEGYLSSNKDELGRASDDCYTFREYMDIPYVNALVWLIEQFLIEAVTQKPGFFLLKKEYWPNAEQFAYSLTHNIDSIRKWSFSTFIKSSFTDLLLFYYPKFVFKNFWSRSKYLITNFEEFWNFDEIRKIVHQHEISSTCFMGTEQTCRDDIDYSLDDKDIKEEIKHFLDSGIELALLGSIRSTHDDVLDKQRKQISLISGKEEVGVRQNQYCYNHELSAEFQNKAGVLYDSSRILLEKPGFKNGIGFPFYSFSIYRHKDSSTLKPFIRSKVMELPVQFDDDHLIISKLKNHSFEYAKEQVDNLLENIIPFNGLLVSEFSISNFAEIEYEKELIDYFITRVKEKEGYISNLRNLAKWWRSREAVIVNESQKGIFLYFSKRLESFTVRVFGSFSVSEVLGIKAEIVNDLIHFHKIKSDTTVEIKLVPKNSYQDEIT